MKHLAKFTFANFIAKIFMFMGKAAITGFNMVSCYYVMKRAGNFDTTGENHVENIYAPILLVGVITYITATMFLNMFDTAVLSLLTCLAIDIDSNGTPKYGPPTFHEKKDKFEGAGKDADTYGDMMEGGEISGEKLFKNTKVQALL
jgi:hypothetical protein